MYCARCDRFIHPVSVLSGSSTRLIVRIFPPALAPREYLLRPLEFLVLFPDKMGVNVQVNPSAGK